MKSRWNVGLVLFGVSIGAPSIGGCASPRALGDLAILAERQDATPWSVVPADPAMPLLRVPFDRAETRAALERMLTDVARDCPGRGGPYGSGPVQVVIGPRGHIWAAAIPAPFAGTRAATCILAALSSVEVSKFDGAPQTMVVQFTVEPRAGD